jgi:hypothetical protein
MVAVDLGKGVNPQSTDTAAVYPYVTDVITVMGGNGKDAVGVGCDLNLASWGDGSMGAGSGVDGECVGLESRRDGMISGNGIECIYSDCGHGLTIHGEVGHAISGIRCYVVKPVGTTTDLDAA